jgi:hypothetical protein
MKGFKMKKATIRIKIIDHVGSFNWSGLGK